MLEFDNLTVILESGTKVVDSVIRCEGLQILALIDDRDLGGNSILELDLDFTFLVGVEFLEVIFGSGNHSDS